MVLFQFLCTIPGGLPSSPNRVSSYTHFGIIIIIIIIYSFEFFTSALDDGPSLEFKWQQVSSNLQDSSQYSGRSH